MKKINNKAFSHFELVLAVVIVAAIATVGAYTYSAKSNKSKADSGVSLNELAQQQDSADNVEGVPVVDDPVAAATVTQTVSNGGAKNSSTSSPVQASAASSSRTRSNMIRIARSQVGVTENPYGSNSGRAVNAYQRYASGVDGRGCMNNVWCASFASWVYYKSTGSGRYRGCAVSTIRNQAKNYGKLHYGLKGVRPGDMVMRNNEHIGIYISGNGSSITTIDGNWGNKVTYHTDRWSYWNSYVDVD
jgi:type II secretory pathway pseudopilin PulG